MGKECVTFDLNGKRYQVPVRPGSATPVTSQVVVKGTALSGALGNEKSEADYAIAVDLITGDMFAQRIAA